MKEIDWFLRAGLGARLGEEKYLLRGLGEGARVASSIIYSLGDETAPDDSARLDSTRLQGGQS